MTAAIVSEALKVGILCCVDGKSSHEPGDAASDNKSLPGDVRTEAEGSDIKAGGILSHIGRTSSDRVTTELSDTSSDCGAILLAPTSVNADGGLEPN